MPGGGIGNAFGVTGAMTDHPAFVDPPGKAGQQLVVAAGTASDLPSPRPGRALRPAAREPVGRLTR